MVVIHRLKNAVRCGTYDTGEARGKGGLGSGERQSVCCELLCLRGKSLPELFQGTADRTSLRPVVSSNARNGLALGYVGPQACH